MGMSVEEGSGKLVTVRVSGELTSAQWHAAQEAAVKRIRQSADAIRIFVIVENFVGWHRGDWNDSSFQSQFDRQIERMAIVGEKKWEDLVLMFVGKGLRRPQIEYFQPAQVEEARRWLTSGDEK